MGMPEISFLTTFLVLIWVKFQKYLFWQFCLIYNVANNEIMDQTDDFYLNWQNSGVSNTLRVTNRHITCFRVNPFNKWYANHCLFSLYPNKQGRMLAESQTIKSLISKTHFLHKNRCSEAITCIHNSIFGASILNQIY